MMIPLMTFATVPTRAITMESRILFAGTVTPESEEAHIFTGRVRPYLHWSH